MGERLSRLFLYVEVRRLNCQAKAFAQRMKAFRASCTSPKDFHELRQGFSPCELEWRWISLYKNISEPQYLQRMTPLPARDSSPLQCGQRPASVRWRASLEYNTPSSQLR